MLCNYCEKEKDETCFRKNRKKCKECEKEYGRKYYKKNKDKRKKWAEENKERMVFLQSRWYQNNKEKRNAKERERDKTDICFKLRKLNRRRLNQCIKKEKGTEKYVGIKFEILKKWLEFNFTPQMNWENHGTYWQIDHVFPVAKFDLEDEKQVQICFNWKNLSPLSAKKNRAKSDNFDRKQLKTHKEQLHLFFQEHENKGNKEKIKDNLPSYLENYNDLLAKHLVAGNPLALSARA